MKSFLFTNAHFEEELKTSFLTPPSHPLFTQLESLSFLLAKPHETTLVSSRPTDDYLEHLQSLGFNTSYEMLHSTCLEEGTLDSWGPSNYLENLAKKSHLNYLVPNSDIVKKIQSKVYALNNLPKLPYSKCIESERELEIWCSSFSGPKVLKDPLAHAGRGHFVFKEKEELLSDASVFLQRQKTPLVAQPWVERVLDFSSQWYIHSSGSVQYLGSCRLINSPKGHFVKSLVGPEKLLFDEHHKSLHHHLSIAKATCETIEAIGFFGHVGFDGFVYIDPETKEHTLQPIIEINARKTLGYTALCLHKTHGKTALSELSYETNTYGKKGLLPEVSGAKKRQKQLFFQAKSV